MPPSSRPAAVKGSSAADPPDRQARQHIRYKLHALQVCGQTPLAGLAVGCARPIKGLLFGADPPLGFLTDSLSVMGDAMIPSMMLVLGSVLCKGPGAGRVPLNVILGILFMRQIAIPFLGGPNTALH